MDIISHAEGAALCIQAMNSKGEEGGTVYCFLKKAQITIYLLMAQQQTDRLFQLAMAKFDTALSSTPDNQLILRNWGDALCQQMQRKTGEERARLVWKAVDKYQQTRCHQSLKKLGNLLYSLTNQQTAEERYF